MATLAGIVRTDIVHAILGLDETFDHSSAIFEVLYHSQLAVPIYIPPVQWWVGSYPHDSEIRVEVHVNAQLLPERGVGIYTLAEAIKVSGQVKLFKKIRDANDPQIFIDDLKHAENVSIYMPKPWNSEGHIRRTEHVVQLFNPIPEAGDVATVTFSLHNIS